MEHIKTLRLFDLAQPASLKAGYELTNGEKQHLEECEECRDVLQAFKRQFGQAKPG